MERNPGHVELRAAHSGAVTDYVAYIVTAGAVFAAVWAITLR